MYTLLGEHVVKPVGLFWMTNSYSLNWNVSEHFPVGFHDGWEVVLEVARSLGSCDLVAEIVRSENRYLFHRPKVMEVSRNHVTIYSRV
jgi:hypothetical protein